MQDDFELIRKYSREDSSEAFEELVKRHLDLVYSVAYRQVGGNDALARDICQEVFISLARCADEIREEVVVSGWLYRAARYTALKAMRSERRRAEREIEALRMDEIDDDDRVRDWEKVRPVLDEAVSELTEIDRSAVCLRFYEKRSFSEIGELLSLSENAARMRVSRALDQLSGVLGKRGIRSTVTALGVVLGGQNAIAAPVGLSASIVSGVGLGTVAVAGSSVLGTLITVMSTSKISLVGVSLIGSLIIGVGLYERGCLESAQLEVDALRSEVKSTGNLDSQIATLRTSLKELMAKQLSLQESMADPDELGPHGFSLLEMEEAMEKWVGRVSGLVKFVSENEHWRIPEMDMLESNDWLDAVKLGEVETVADYRMQLAKVRTKAKYKTQVILQEAFRSYLEQSGGTPPEEASELYEYIEGPLSPLILNRYDIVKYSDIRPESESSAIVLYEARPVDHIWEDLTYFGPNLSSGSSAEPGHRKWDSVRDGLRRFKEEVGRSPEGPDELIPYLEKPVSEELYEEIFEAMTTAIDVTTN
ncbi:sigma-70 family RNA polymerase sigma factor [Puniceicoccaceae bacterium K14]|nr:sigma-70 family RNA polymerase sigma factor [Puniceicoccaceae bacterium K14]